MFEIVAIVTMLTGTSPSLELTLNRPPFESVGKCEAFKSTEEFTKVKKELESGSLFPNVSKEKFATYNFEYKCEEKKQK